MNGIADAALKIMNHDMIREHMSLPEYPEMRTRLLRAFLNGGGRTDADRSLNEAVSLAVSLAQLGLDTHELVERSDKSRRQQMTVLAGDYFSSRFYQLLSQANNVQSISMLSNSICEVNRMKMGLYAKAKKLLLSAEEYVRATVDVNTHLFLSFTSWMEGMCRKYWPNLLRTVAECELFIGDLSRTRPDNVINSWSYWYVLQHGSQDEINMLLSGSFGARELQEMLSRHDVLAQLSGMLEEKVNELKLMLQDLDSERLMTELTGIAEPLLQFRTRGPAAKVLEEI
ncbi:heptaprenyl diphosphate synthase component 1 [Paenibacillus alkalitolerans]|uniref:heptaprenyl diphosphate synthase component 1 n=1 Tax=Paenibacillus alkalitolerans TaxID=2799335 RepID=UPI0018F5F61C|nr:heptaprenyl diphosphate synthase component 1 [Paenibacillus alkalitolerans]